MTKTIRKCVVLIVCMITATTTMAQWRAGVTMGAVSNSLDIDKQFQYDWRYHNRWGMEFGAAGQYDIREWFGVRAELNYLQRGYRQQRTGILDGTDYKYRNNYLVMPVMASFSFGGEKLRGFVNAGVYGGYWLSGSVTGSYCIIEEAILPIDQDYDFNSTRDNRWDFGYVGGVGVEYRWSRHWAAQAEARCYYSVTSTTKDYMRIKDGRYNNTVSLQAGVFYIF
ncbi:MAG: porin family protein [Prevotella sp.]